MIRFARLTSVALLTLCFDSESWAQSRFSKDQQLVVASFDLDVANVKALLAEGANPNARLGVYDRNLFADKWTLAYSHVGSSKWTPLLAVANSHRAPQPQERAENTSDGLEAARRKMNSIDPKLIQERDERRVEITKLLIAAKANLDLEDQRGTTALAAAVYEGFDSIALLLIAAGAEINTKSGIYIDGTDEITPLHRATRHPTVLQAMLKRTPKLEVQDSTGETPLHWATRDHNVASVKLLLAAGANPTAKDKEGHTPVHWCTTYSFTTPDDAAKKEITKLLSDAQAKK